jgi:hypothetical protein
MTEKVDSALQVPCLTEGKGWQDYDKEIADRPLSEEVAFSRMVELAATLVCEDPQAIHISSRAYALMFRQLDQVVELLRQDLALANLGLDKPQ